MELEDIPTFADIEHLSTEERKAIMLVREGRSEDAPIELLMRNLFIWAIVTKSSDVHISGHGERQTPVVKISVRTRKALESLVYTGQRGKHFESKLFQLTNTPQGGTTPDILDTRFGIRLPASFARRHGLTPKQDAEGGDRPYLVSIRVGYIATFDGWTFVCRLLDQQLAPSLGDLNLSYVMRKAISLALSQPSGLILASGPTGSGKSTLLRAMLEELNNGQRSIVTIEDPVEGPIEGRGPIKQIEVRGDITFPRALRATLRLDPDIILVGEIRDPETMGMALRAAQTGHLVLGTIHANSAPHTLSRALDMTVDKVRDAYVLAETVKLVLAQRLIDRYEGATQLRDLRRDESAWLQINGMGHMRSIPEVVPEKKIGKLALIEAFSMTPEIKDAMRAERLDTSEIYRLASEQPQYETLASAGVRAVQGLGCNLRDCMTRLDSTSEAMSTPGPRIRLARDHGISLVQVAAATDAFARDQDEGGSHPIDDFVQQVKAA